VARTLPSYSALKAYFPTVHADEVKRQIGGAVNAGWITNACVIRVSRALNYAGHDLPASYPGLLLVKGGDGKRYALRVKEFKRYMTGVYGPPRKSAVAGKAGIIMFDVRGWSDATGHFDLWNGSKCEYSDYSNQAHEILLWTCP
jgi:hypothetical protein